MNIFGSKNRTCAEKTGRMVALLSIIRVNGVKSASAEWSMHGVGRDFPIIVINHTLKTQSNSQILCKIINNTAVVSQHISLPVPSLTFDYLVNIFRVKRGEHHGNRCLSAFVDSNFLPKLLPIWRSW